MAYCRFHDLKIKLEDRRLIHPSLREEESNGAGVLAPPVAVFDVDMESLCSRTRDLLGDRILDDIDEDLESEGDLDLSFAPKFPSISSQSSSACECPIPKL